MQLLPEEKLIWSPTVANSRMNRERVASGVNSYEKEFKFKPQEYLESLIETHGQASWLDICCGQGNALIQTADYFSGKELENKVQLKGIDLLDAFHPNYTPQPFFTLEQGSVIDWLPDQRYDLITCVHGLHYLGDKLRVIERATQQLSQHGMFIANLDLSNISIATENATQLLKSLFKKAAISYNSKSRILKCVAPSTIHFNLEFMGADDSSGPNYTGQEAVTSYYTSVYTNGRTLS